MMKAKMKRDHKKSAASLQALSKDLLSLQMIEAASQYHWDEVRSLIEAGVSNVSCLPLKMTNLSLLPPSLSPSSSPSPHSLNRD